MLLRSLVISSLILHPEYGDVTANLYDYLCGAKKARVKNVAS
jgi:hypothetical protein